MEIEPGEDGLGLGALGPETAGQIAIALRILQQDIAVAQTRPQAGLAGDDDVVALLLGDKAFHMPRQALAAGEPIRPFPLLD